MREIRMLRSRWRGLETESRLDLHGHERGNPGHRQDHDNDTDAEAETNERRRVEYGYDPSGNLLTVGDSAIDNTQSGGELVYIYEAVSPDSGANPAYDARNRLRRMVVDYPDLSPKTLTSTYDRFGNRSAFDMTGDELGRDLVDAHLVVARLLGHTAIDPDHTAFTGLDLALDLERLGVDHMGLDGADRR